MNCQYCGEGLVVMDGEGDCSNGCLTPCTCDAIADVHDAAECEDTYIVFDRQQFMVWWRKAHNQSRHHVTEVIAALPAELPRMARRLETANE